LSDKSRLLSSFFKSTTRIFFISASVRDGAVGVASTTSSSISTEDVSTGGVAVLVTGAEDAVGAEGATAGADMAGGFTAAAAGAAAAVAVAAAAAAACVVVFMCDMREEIEVYPLAFFRLGLGGRLVTGGAAANMASR